jgi:hypothetical protein
VEAVGVAEAFCEEKLITGMHVLGKFTEKKQCKIAYK